MEDLKSLKFIKEARAPVIYDFFKNVEGPVTLESLIKETLIDEKVWMELFATGKIELFFDRRDGLTIYVTPIATDERGKAEALQSTVEDLKETISVQNDQFQDRYNQLKASLVAETEAQLAAKDREIAAVRRQGEKSLVQSIDSRRQGEKPLAQSMDLGCSLTSLANKGRFKEDHLLANLKPIYPENSWYTRGERDKKHPSHSEKVSVRRK